MGCRSGEAGGPRLGLRDIHKQIHTSYTIHRRKGAAGNQRAVTLTATARA